MLSFCDRHRGVWRGGPRGSERSSRVGCLAAPSEGVTAPSGGAAAGGSEMQGRVSGWGSRTQRAFHSPKPYLILSSPGGIARIFL